jgi:hypothetical protein
MERGLMEEEYRGFRIILTEQKNFRVYSGGSFIGEYETLNRATSRIDRLLDAEANAKSPKPKRKRVTAFHLGHNQKFSVVTITSKAESKYGDKFWTVDVGGCRGQEYASDLYPVTEANSKLVEEIQTVQKEIEALDTKVYNLKMKLVKVKAKDLEVEVEGV